MDVGLTILFDVIFNTIATNHLFVYLLLQYVLYRVTTTFQLILPKYPNENVSDLCLTLSCLF